LRHSLRIGVEPATPCFFPFIPFWTCWCWHVLTICIIYSFPQLTINATSCAHRQVAVWRAKNADRMSSACTVVTTEGALWETRTSQRLLPFVGQKQSLNGTTKLKIRHCPLVLVSELYFIYVYPCYPLHRLCIYWLTQLLIKQKLLTISSKTSSVS